MLMQNLLCLFLSAPAPRPLEKKLYSLPQFYAPADFTVAPRAAAQRLRFASTIRFRPAALNFLFGFRACFAGAVPDSPRIAAQRFRCASAILFRASVLILLRLRGPRLGALSALAPLRGNMARNSRICSSSRLF
jgi:hypothetical protein